MSFSDFLDFLHLILSIFIILWFVHTLADVQKEVKDLKEEIKRLRLLIKDE